MLNYNDARESKKWLRKVNHCRQYLRQAGMQDKDIVLLDTDRQSTAAKTEVIIPACLWYLKIRDTLPNSLLASFRSS